MTCSQALSQWEGIVSTHLPHLSRPQARVLAALSYCMVLAKSCGITSVVSILAPLLKQSASTVRLGLALVGSVRAAPGVGDGSQYTFGSLHRAGDQCALPGLRHPGGLE